MAVGAPQPACLPTPVQGVWAEQPHCPQMQETDAIQLATDRLLDLADAIKDSGLLGAGYFLLAVRACPALAHPSHRTALVGYAEARGISMVFAHPAPNLLSVAEASTGTPHFSAAWQVQSDTIGGSLYNHHPMHEQILAPTAACWRETLVQTSGASGWNDLHKHLCTRTPQYVGELRIEFGLSCMRGEPTVISSRLLAMRDVALRTQVCQSC